jgi:uncharacterized protein YjbI with pentapeptide repeats
LSEQRLKHNMAYSNLAADCKNCFGLCCVALPYAKSADFAFDKEGGTACPNLDSEYRCKIHQNLREKGFHGCVGYECFGAGQKVSQITFGGKSWKGYPELAKEMFEVFPIMQQLHEMLLYLNEAINREEAQTIFKDLIAFRDKTEYLTNLSPKEIIELDVARHRKAVNELLICTSELVRSKVKQNQKGQKKIGKDFDLIGAKLKGKDLRGVNLRGALLIAADLREADMRYTDVIGADFRDADLSGANFTGSIFLTQAQVNSAKGDVRTKLPSPIRIPGHWIPSK